MDAVKVDAALAARIFARARTVQCGVAFPRRAPFPNGVTHESHFNTLMLLAAARLQLPVDTATLAACVALAQTRVESNAMLREFRGDVLPATVTTAHISHYRKRWLDIREEDFAPCRTCGQMVDAAWDPVERCRACMTAGRHQRLRR